MSSLGTAVFAYMQTTNGIKTYPVQIPNDIFTSEDDVAAAYIVLPGDGPLLTNELASTTATRTERVRLSLMLRSRSYAVLETLVRKVVRMFDGVSRQTWGGVFIQAASVIGWEDTPLEPDTKLFQAVVDVALTYDEVPA